VIRPVLEFLRIVKKEDWEGTGFDLKIHAMLEKI